MQIPGFQIEREIGRGGMARVYLAVQSKFGRLVALKVVSADFARYDDFRTRFMDESRINAQLTHPNIVQVYDVAVHEDCIYLVMEYLSGGDLNDRLARGMHIQGVLKVIKDMGRALDYAHRKGVIHRDIKPENILFRDDGSAVLTDFGIARLVAGQDALTRTGTVVGTPQYMSPEQAAGRELDGRSDLYSLGVVFYRMLTGDVPFQAETAVAVGIKHLQDPVPRLPAYLSAFQDVIDRALAKKPDLRFQSGAEFAEAVDAIRADVRLPNATIKTEAVTTQEIRAVAASMLTTIRDPRRAERQSRKLRRKQALRGTGVMLLLLTIAAMGGYWVYERPDEAARLLAAVGLSDEPGLQEAWNEARALHQDPNQGLAAVVAGYRRVVDIDTQHRGAREALAGLASQWQDDIAQALSRNDVPTATSKLADARIAFPEDTAFEALSSKLKQQITANELVAEARSQLRGKGLDDSRKVTVATQNLTEALRLAPDHQQARTELERIAAHYTQRALAAVQAGDMEVAITSIDRASTASPTFAGLTQARAQIQQATTTRTAIAQMIEQARNHRANNALVEPAGANAAELYHQVLSIDPGNAIATHGLEELLTQVRVTVRRHLEARHFEQAAATVERAAAVNLDARAVDELRQALATEQSRLASVQRLLNEAQTFIVDGFLTQPERGNAVAALREVQRLDPGNATAEELLKQVAERLAQVAQDAHDVGLDAEAGAYLDLALAIVPDVQEWQRLRSQWSDSAADAR